ncbi:hypothetical protein V8B97DRAFT_1915061 [Scleroderma yunnanense]
MPLRRQVMGTTSFSLLLYGTSVGQHLFYIRFFPEDHNILKSVVFTVLYAILVFAHDTSTSDGSLYWEMLVTCRRSIAPECTGGLPWQMNAVILKANVMVILLCTQSLDNSPLRGHSSFWGWNSATVFDNWVSPVGAISSAVCDGIITISIFIYLRPLRNSPLWKASYLRQFNFIFIQMGIITFATTLTVLILYSPDLTSGKYLSTAPGTILPKIYTNSMLAV